jgi:hypothetical protein
VSDGFWENPRIGLCGALSSGIQRRSSATVWLYYQFVGQLPRGPGAPKTTATRCSVVVSRCDGKVAVPTAHPPQPGESFNVTDFGLCLGQGHLHGAPRGQPGGARLHEVGVDRDRQRRAHQAGLPFPPVGRPTTARESVARRRRGVRAAGQPAFLLALTWLCAQPVQYPQTSTSLLLGPRQNPGGTVSGQLVEHLLAALSRGGPPRGLWAGRNRSLVSADPIGGAGLALSITGYPARFR